MNLAGKYALVTGGNAGIGLAITRSLVEAGAHVLVVGRDHARLESARAASNRVTVLQADLISSAGREQVVEYVRAGDTPLDILVNNAGTMQYFDVTVDDALARLEAELALDLHAPIHLAMALLPLLLARPEAALVNVTTGLVYAPFGATPGYSAAKAGLHAFTRSLRWQVRASGLKVLELLPPAVETQLTRRYDGPKIKPAKVAQALVEALVDGTDEVRPGQAKALYAMSRIAPDFIFKTLNKLADKTPKDHAAA